MWLSIEEYALAVKISRKTVQRRIRDDHVESKKENGRRLIWLEESQGNGTRPLENYTDQELFDQVRELMERLDQKQTRIDQLTDKLTTMAELHSQTLLASEINHRQAMNSLEAQVHDLRRGPIQKLLGLGRKPEAIVSQPETA